MMSKPRDTALGASVVLPRATATPFKPQKLAGLSGDWRFRRLKNKGKPGRSQILTLKWIAVGNAVVRNRIRRRIREALRRMDLPPLEAVVIANPEAANARFGEIVRALYSAMKKAGLSK
jgi:ribonuclease P protein component